MMFIGVVSVAAEKEAEVPANKVSFVAAVALNEDGHPIAMNMNIVKGFWLTEISRWAKHHLQSDSTVISDGLPCFSAVKKQAAPYQ